MRAVQECDEGAQETSCPAEGTGSLAGAGQPHGTATPDFSKTQGKGPTVLTDSLESEGGAAELGWERLRETGQQDEGGREQQLGRKLPTSGRGVGGRALPLLPSQLIGSLQGERTRDPNHQRSRGPVTFFLPLPLLQGRRTF